MLLVLFARDEGLSKSGPSLSLASFPLQRVLLPLGQFPLAEGPVAVGPVYSGRSERAPLICMRRSARQIPSPRSADRRLFDLWAARLPLRLNRLSLKKKKT